MARLGLGPVPWACSNGLKFTAKTSSPRYPRQSSTQTRPCTSSVSCATARPPSSANAAPATAPRRARRRTRSYTPAFASHSPTRTMKWLAPRGPREGPAVSYSGFNAETHPLLSWSNTPSASKILSMRLIIFYVWISSIHLESCASPRCINQSLVRSANGPLPPPFRTGELEASAHNILNCLRLSVSATFLSRFLSFIFFLTSASNEKGAGD